MEELAKQTCSADIGTTALSGRQIQGLLVQVPGWDLVDREIRQEFRFRNFRDAMSFVNRIADLADAQNHHPDIFISYNKVTLVLATHTIDGLSLNDFILAAKIDLLEQGSREKAA